MSKRIKRECVSMRKCSALLFVVVMLSALLCSCALGGEGVTMDKDQRKVNQKFEEVLTALQTQDSSTLRLLFSEESLQKAEAFDETVPELFVYFEGSVESVNDWGACYVETSKEDNQIVQSMEATYDVKTTKGDFRFAVRYVAQDTVNPNNVGIHSLYIVKAQDDSSLEYAYWGDGKFTPGIHIGIPNAE